MHSLSLRGMGSTVVVPSFGMVLVCFVWGSEGEFWPRHVRYYLSKVR